MKYPQEWNVEEEDDYYNNPFVMLRYEEGCLATIQMILDTHSDYSEVTKRKERGDKEENIKIGNINGVYFDSVYVCSPPVCPESLVRDVYLYNKSKLYHIRRTAVKNGNELKCVDNFDQILSTFKFIE